MLKLTEGRNEEEIIEMMLDKIRSLYDEDRLIF